MNGVLLLPVEPQLANSQPPIESSSMKITEEKLQRDQRRIELYEFNGAIR